MRVLIIDGYVDEPACLGVPTYLAPYARYIAGAMAERGIKEEDIFYRTIDQLRTGKERNRFDITVIVAGMTVPGKYLRATAISQRELMDLSHLGGIKVLGGPIRLGFGEEGGSTAKELTIPGIALAKKDIEAFIYDLLDGTKEPEGVKHRMRT